MRKILSIATCIFLLAAIAFTYQNCEQKPLAAMGSYETDSASSRLVAETPLENQNLQALPMNINAASATDLSKIRVYSGEVIVENDIERQAVFTTRITSAVLSKNYVPVDTSKTYEVSGFFRSSGTVPSNLYLGAAPYDAKGNFVGSDQVSRHGNGVRVVFASGTSLTTAETLVGWQQVPTSAYQRVLGVYLRGDLTKLPDFVINDATGTYNETANTGAFATAVGNTIQLVRPIPPAILGQFTNSTVIANHGHGGSYLYSSAIGSIVPNTWTEFKGTITGEAFGNGMNTFRPTTRYIRALILPNYAQSGDVKLSFDDISIRELP